MALALVGLAAWLAGWQETLAGRLTRIPMAPTTALLLLLLGLIAASRQSPARLWRRVLLLLCSLVGVLALLILVARLGGWVWVAERRLGGGSSLVDQVPTGLTAPLTAACVLLLATSAGLLLTPRHHRPALRHAGQGAACGSLALTGATLFFYLVGTPPPLWMGRIPMAWLTALSLTLVALSLLAGSVRQVRWRGLRAAARVGGRARRGSRLLLRAYLLSNLLLLSAALLIGRQWQTNERRRVEEYLTTIAEFKTASVSEWLEECRNDLQQATQTTAFRRAATALAARPSDAAASAEAADLLHYLAHQGEVLHVLLADAAGRPLVGWPHLANEHPAELRHAAAAIAAGADDHWSDLHRHAAGDRIVLALWQAVRAVPAQPGDRGPVVGLVQVLIAADHYLFPVLQRWPVPSETAESLLVRRDGNAVVYLNELRHASGSALTLRRPLTDRTLPATRGVLGETAPMLGSDYRGEPVLAVARAVPGTPWVLVAKVDQHEAFRELRQRGLLLGGGLLLVLLAVALGFALTWWQRSALVLRGELAAQQRSHAVAARLAGVLRAANDLILLCDVEGRIVEANDRAAQLLGLSSEALRGRAIGELLAPAAAAATLAQVATIESPSGLVLETALVGADGRAIEVEASIQRTEAATGGSTLWILRDLTERRTAAAEQARLEDELAHAHRLDSLGRLAGGVAHDFNNVLAVILGTTELLLDDLPADSPVTADLLEVRRAAERARDLTRQLLAFGRRQVFELRVFDVNSVIRSAELLLRRAVGEAVRVDLLLAPGAGRVKADAGRFEQALLNLCLNARDAMPEGGLLSIETAAVLLDEHYIGSHPGVQPGPFVAISISDTGAGIAEEALAHVFEPFYTTKRLGHGTGLGLASVYGTIKQLGGDVRVYTELGRGTTFRIYLPRVDDEVDSPADDRAELPIQGAGELVLVVEDDAAVRHTVSAMAARLGYRVLVAASVRAALDLASAAPDIALVLTDVIMPDFNGRQGVELLRAHLPALRALFMSGYTANVIVHHGVVDDGIHFISKPFTELDLSRKLREALLG
ncbi:MAG: response regulator [Fimbriimonadaceae bacterium]|nr:response regulator [Fimbriimonadaceae bacterium]